MLERYSLKLERQVAELQEEAALMQRALDTLRLALADQHAGSGVEATDCEATEGISGEGPISWGELGAPASWG